MLAPWEVLEVEIIRASRRLVDIAPENTDGLKALLAEHDDAETTPERLREVKRELHGRLADARRHFFAHRKRSSR